MNPLNYCRQMALQLRERVAIPNLAPDIAEDRHVLDLIAMSEKFLLPEGGLLDDVDPAKLDPDMPLRLPFPCIALEIPPAMTWDLMGPKVKCVIFAREHPDAGEIAVSLAICSNATGRWHVLGHDRLPVRGYLRNDADGLQRVFVVDGHDGKEHASSVAAAVVVQLLDVLGCHNVSTMTLRPRDRSRKVKAALPFDSFHVLMCRPVVERDAAGAGGSSGRRSPRRHIRRGCVVRESIDGRRKHFRQKTIVRRCGPGGEVTKQYAVPKAGGVGIEMPRNAGDGQPSYPKSYPDGSAPGGAQRLSR